MPDVTTPPPSTILIKKSDGTEVRMTLEEFKKMRGLGGKTPDSVRTTYLAGRQAPGKQDTRTMEQSKKLERSVPVRPVSSQAVSTTTPVVDIFKDEAMAEKPRMPVASAPKVAPPAVSQFRNQLQKVAGGAPDVVQDRWQGPMSKPLDMAPSTSLGTSQGKLMVHDIHPPDQPRATMGPKEEMEAFNLVDFRRLAPRAKEAGTKLVGKFDNWKQESFLLYRTVVPAWRKSPLYHAYQQVIIDALRSDIKLHDEFAGVNPKEQLTEEEFGALVEVNKMLS